MTAERAGQIGRWILTAALVVGVYSETGIWTALFCGLVALNLELVTNILRHQGGLNAAVMRGLKRAAGVRGKREAAS